MDMWLEMLEEELDPGVLALESRVLALPLPVVEGGCPLISLLSPSLCLGRPMILGLFINQTDTVAFSSQICDIKSLQKVRKVLLTCKKNCTTLFRNK